MDPKQFYRRLCAVVVLLGLILTGMGSALYDLQINNGEDYYRQSQYKIAETETVEAARGQILDRNGRVLVSNEVVYQVTLDISRMEEDQNPDDDRSGKDQRNEILSTLLDICREEGVEWTDNLPISQTQPFTFTTENPYYTTSTDEEGNTTRSLTQLGKLAVKLKWISDPTAQPEEEEEDVQEEPAAAEEPGLWDKIKAFFTGSDPTPETTSTTKKESLPTYLTAEELLGKLCESFSIQGEGAVDRKKAESAGQTVPTLNIGDLDPLEARALAGVMYEASLRTQEITWNPYIFAEDVDIDFISRVKENSLSGVVIEATTVRSYHTEYAAHLLGRVAAMSPEEWEYYKTLDEDGDGKADYQMDDTVGKDGVELAFESYLRGTPGVRTLERNTSGKIVSESWQSEPEPGDNVVLTIDIDLQKKVEDTLAESLPNLESKEVEGAACVVLDVNSGDVLASASYPTYSLATFSQDWTENASNPLNPLVNRALNGLYPPGSTFKMITAIAALETGVITPDTKIRDEGVYTYWSSPQPKCWYYRQYGAKHGLINVSEAIEVSCNYFFYDVGRRVGIDTLVDYANRFGLGQKTGIELPEKVGGVGSPERSEALGQKWYEGNILNVAIGQDNTQVTPIQLANYIATLVNGGTRYSTHLLKEVKSNDFSQILYTYEPEAVETIEIQDENLNAVKAGMLALTTEPTRK